MHLIEDKMNCEADKNEKTGQPRKRRRLPENSVEDRGSQNHEELARENRMEYAAVFDARNWKEAKGAANNERDTEPYDPEFSDRVFLVQFEQSQKRQRAAEREATYA
jgi:hypothetical protein